MTKVARQLLVDVNFDPLEGLLRVAKNRRVPLDLRIKAMAAAVPFVYPKLSTTVIHAQVENNVTVTQIQQLAMADPELADAFEKISLAMSAAARRALPPPDVIDVRPEPQQ